MAAVDNPLDLFEEFCRVCRDLGLAEASLGDMRVRFQDPAPPEEVAIPPMRRSQVDDRHQPDPEPGTPVSPREAPYHRLFGKRLPTFQRKE